MLRSSVLPQTWLNSQVRLLHDLHDLGDERLDVEDLLRALTHAEFLLSATAPRDELT